MLTRGDSARIPALPSFDALCPPHPPPPSLPPSAVQYAALVTQFTSKTRTVLKQLPLPGVSSDAGAVRATHPQSQC
jgi:hypothetical protein